MTVSPSARPGRRYPCGPTTSHSWPVPSLLIGLLLGAPALAQDEPTAQEDPPAWTEKEIPRDLVKIYGFVDGYVEKVADTPALNANGDTIYEHNPHEFDVLNLHLMTQGVLFGRYKFYVNMAAPGSGSPAEDAPVQLRNAWVEAPLSGEFVVIRLGKTYRRFGLYNEILDAVPTFIGIEPPELFDKDHLLVTRTTNAMLHGRIPLGVGNFDYALMTGNDERAGAGFPIGLDARYDSGGGLVFGTSYYTTGGGAQPSVAVGEGPPAGGVLPWIVEDDYVIFGGFAELRSGGLILQTELWRAQHSVERDPEQVLQLLDADLIPAQLERFGLDVEEPTADDVVRQAQYSIDTAYVRAGYSLLAPVLDQTWEFVPYAQFDYYRNPETIASKSFGGDNESGLSDNGIFYKTTLGLVVRPTPAVALKADGSAHIQEFNGQTVFYPEARLSFSLFWDLWSR